jgi:TRAP-type C4-dicarboxylate transport system substrate-binding protein
MRLMPIVAVTIAALALGGCGSASQGHVVVLRMESPDPGGIEHDPALEFFVNQVARLSSGQLQIRVENYPRGRDGSVDEAGLLRALARGRADLGWAHTGSFDAIGVHSFDVLDTPMLIDNYRTEAAVVSSDLSGPMLAGVGRAGLTGLALLSGPLLRLIGTDGTLLSADDIRNHTFATRPSSVALMAVHAVGGHPMELSYAAIDSFPGLYRDGLGNAGRPAFLEDDLDSIFFDRYGGRCAFGHGGCDTSRPFVATNVVLGPEAVAIVANPRRMRGMSARERAWLARAAAAARSYAAREAGQDSRLIGQLCAAGVRFGPASPAALTSLRRAWRPLYAQLERGPAGSSIRGILALRGRSPRSQPLPIPLNCRLQPSRPSTAHGLRSTLPNGVYRIEVTAADIRAAGAEGSPAAQVQPGVETLTLRDGHWQINFTEPGKYSLYGTYAGSPLRTSWFTYRAGQLEESFFSIVATSAGLRFFVVQSWDNFGVEEALYASHVWRRIGS